jgi:hypothetical protein
MARLNIALSQRDGGFFIGGRDDRPSAVGGKLEDIAAGQLRLLVSKNICRIDAPEEHYAARRGQMDRRTDAIVRPRNIAGKRPWIG